MKQEFLEKQQRILNFVSGLPRKMLLLHGQENMTEFVLHELCNKNCFNLVKAAYFVDNPDFDCLKGMAGFCREEAYVEGDIWNNPKSFSIHMQSAPFNNKVRTFAQCSLKKKGCTEQNYIDAIKSSLGIENPKFYSWNMKHDNHGFLVYEAGCSGGECPDQFIQDGVCLLGFCPLY